MLVVFKQLKLKEDVDQLPIGVKLLNEGKLDLMSPCLLPYLRALITKVSSFVNADSCRLLGQHMLEVAGKEIEEDENVYKIFFQCISSAGVTESSESDLIHQLYIELSRKLFHARVNEYWSASAELMLKQSGKAVMTEQSLRDELKTYSSTKTRY